MNPMGMGTLNKSVGAILGVKWDKRVKQAATMPHVVGSQAGTSQVGSDAGTSEGRQTLQQMVEKLEARFEKFENEMKGWKHLLSYLLMPVWQSDSSSGSVWTGYYKENETCELSLGFLFELDCIGLFMMDFVFSGGLTLKIAVGMLMRRVGPGLYAWLLDWFAVLLCFSSCLLFWQTVVVSWAVTKGAGAEFGYVANQLGLNGCCTGLFLI
ncbi:unnamed protein product [Ilex paraguariensis]|uniref:Uncharacterized protein n=1 Tax=Ilex paraguariensis TaxID=185542 RepID=A0ABC8RJJ2_9AQUA